MKRGMPLLPGTLDMLVLKALQGSQGLHGGAIARKIRGLSGGVLKVPQGSWQPALERLVAARHVIKLKRTEINGKLGLILYRPNRLAGNTLRSKILQWKNTSEAINKVINS